MTSDDSLLLTLRRLDEIERKLDRILPPESSLAGDRMQFGQLRRREFITLLGGVAAWPVVARTQQPMPVSNGTKLIWLPAANAWAFYSFSPFNRCWVTP